jgi:hypothetical protein
MTETTQLTNTIFKSKKISFETNDDDYRFVKTLKNIKKGELLLIEHCYNTDKFEIIPKAIQNSPELFNNLYPRKMSWNESFVTNPTSEISDICIEKAEKNSFGGNGHFSVGLDISKFNHSNKPNSRVEYCGARVIDEEVYCRVLYVYSTRDINIDEEITIWYSNGYIQTYFGENIDQEYEHSFELEKVYIEKILTQYLSKEISRTILFNHLCIYYGLYLTNDMICHTKRFLEYFTKKFKKEYNNQNIIQWLTENKKKCYIGLELKR